MIKIENISSAQHVANASNVIIFKSRNCRKLTKWNETLERVFRILLRDMITLPPIWPLDNSKGVPMGCVMIFVGIIEIMGILHNNVLVSNIRYNILLARI